ncbi:hypothetical protein [Aquabacterium sp. A08]|uniref:hypothetical protein n=1 Tax=Aquabacterium sp. A08 TaxID=2718532 RepID=UPI00141DE795|nr:hypothetical protein [Aquabacterium sp. A08]NIC43747.1 hypothetical protein [Aquabacterium sp. A08]
MTTSSVHAEPAVVRAVRVSTYVLLTLAALPVLFLLPFMFDDPKMGHPIPALLLFAAVLSPVGAIAFTRGAYRRAVASEQWGRCLAWSLLPLVIPLPLFMSIGGYFKLKDHFAYQQRHVMRDADGVVAHLALPPGCDTPNGFWNFDQGQETGLRGEWEQLDGQGMFRCFNDATTPKAYFTLRVANAKNKIPNRGNPIGWTKQMLRPPITLPLNGVQVHIDNYRFVSASEKEKGKQGPHIQAWEFLPVGGTTSRAKTYFKGNGDIHEIHMELSLHPRLTGQLRLINPNATVNTPEAMWRHIQAATAFGQGLLQTRPAP